MNNTAHTPRPLPVWALLTSREYAMVMNRVTHAERSFALSALTRAEFKQLIRDTARTMYPHKMEGH